MMRLHWIWLYLIWHSLPKQVRSFQISLFFSPSHVAECGIWTNIKTTSDIKFFFFFSAKFLYVLFRNCLDDIISQHCFWCHNIAVVVAAFSSRCFHLFLSFEICEIRFGSQLRGIHMDKIVMQLAMNGIRSPPW